MVAVIPLPTAETWPLTDAPNEVEIGLDLTDIIRDRHERTAATAAAAVALTGGWPGQEVAVGNFVYKWLGTRWKLWHTLEEVAFTPTFNAGWLFGTDGTTVGFYRVVNGEYCLRLEIVFGSTGSVAIPSPAFFSLPAAPVHTNGTYLTSDAVFQDTSGAASFPLHVDIQGASARLLVGGAGGSYVGDVPAGTSAPAYVGNSDKISINNLRFLPA